MEVEIFLGPLKTPKLREVVSQYEPSSTRLQLDPAVTLHCRRVYIPISPNTITQCNREFLIANWGPIRGYPATCFQSDGGGMRMRAPTTAQRVARGLTLMQSKQVATMLPAITNNINLHRRTKLILFAIQLFHKKRENFWREARICAGTVGQFRFQQ